MKDHDDIVMTDNEGKITGNVGKDTIIVDGVEITYQEAYEKTHEKSQTDNRSE